MITQPGDMARTTGDKGQPTGPTRMTPLGRCPDALKRALDASGDMVAIKDADLTLFYVNPALAAFLGRAAKDVVGRADHDLFPQDVADRLRADDLAVLLNATSVSHDHLVASRAGLVWISARKDPVVDNGRVIGIVTVMRDVSRQADALRALRRDSVLLDRFFTQGVVAVAYLDRHFNFLRVNAAFAGDAPGEPAAFVGRNHFKVFPDARTEAIFRAVLKTGESYGETAQPFPRAGAGNGGGTGYRDISVQPVRDAVGAIDGLIVTHVDVTERERTLIALRDSERRYRLLADNATDIISAHDPDGRCTFVSQSCQGLLGRSPESVLGLGPLELCHPDDQARVTRLLDRLRERGGVIRLRHRVQHANGTWIWVETCCRTVHDPDGVELRQLIAVTRDVSRQVREQEATRRGRRLYKGLFEGSSAPMLLIDPDSGRIVRANPAAARYYGYSQRALSRMVIQDINAMDPDALAAERAKAAAGSRSVFQFRHRRADGTERDVQVHSTPITLEGRRLLFSIIQDNTEALEAKRALERSEAEKALILSSISDLVAYFEAPDMRVVWTNAAAARSVDQDPTGIIGRRCHVLWADRETPCEDCPVKACFASGAATEGRIVTPDGRTWSVGAFPARDADGGLKGVVEVARDITAVALSEEKFEKAFRTNATLMSISDPQTGRFIEANDTLLRTVGLRREAVIGRTSVDLGLFSSDDARNEAIGRLLGPDPEPAIDFRFTRPDGRPFVGEMSAHLITSGAQPLLLSMVIDVTHQRDLMEQLEHKATHDVLTGAFNRQQADRVLEHEVRRVDRMGGALSAIMADIDRFKAINDRHGHPVGDQVLSAVVDRMTERIRDTDTLARWGGEEFLVVLPGTDRAGAVALAETLRTAVSDRPMAHEHRVSISLGVAQYRPGESVRDWVARTDAALYAAKGAGRDRVCADDDAPCGSAPAVGAHA